MSTVGKVGALVSAGLWAALASSACLVEDRDDPAEELGVECIAAADCAHLDDGDRCYGAPYCEHNHCTRAFLQDGTDCQCAMAFQCEDFGFEERPCLLLTCDEDHQCGAEIVPEGPAPAAQQDGGDCATWTCDGISPDGVVEADPGDRPEDHNDCTADLCTELGPENVPVPDGDYCTGDATGRCYGGQCYPGCVTDDDDLCGDEGPNEPQNDTGNGATAYTEAHDVCGMLDGDDIDWFKLTLVDDDFDYDVLHFDLHASAAVVELCAYVVCNNVADPNGGYPAGGCSNKLTGPLGSLGCCWQGEPEGLSPSWDLDCTGTGDDAGTLYFSIRAPDGDACETYLMSAWY